MKLLAVCLILASVGISYSQSNCVCKKAKKDETTRISSTRLNLDEQTVKKIEGQVTLYGDIPVEDALVEIFTNTEISHLTIDSPERERKQKRIAACFTDEEGRFCFKGIPAGKYELRVSKRPMVYAIGVVVVDPKEKQDNKIVIGLTMAI